MYLSTSYLSIVGVDFDCWGKSIFCFMITFQLDVAHTNQEMTLRSLHWPRFSSPWFLQHYKYNPLVSWVHRTNNTISNTHNIKYLNFSHIDFSWFIFIYVFNLFTSNIITWLWTETITKNLSSNGSNKQK